MEPEGYEPEKGDNPIVKYIKGGYFRFLRIRGTPKQIALGLALGVFIGVTPFMGLHAATAVCLAALFKWNKIAAAVGVFISNPATAPFLYWFTYQVGELIYKKKTPFIPPSEFGLTGIIQVVKQTPEVLWVLTLGGFVVGLPLAFAAYWISYNAIVKYRKDIKAKLAEKKRRLIQKAKRKKQA